MSAQDEFERFAGLDDTEVLRSQLRMAEQRANRAIARAAYLWSFIAFIAAAVGFWFGRDFKAVEKQAKPAVPADDPMATAYAAMEAIPAVGKYQIIADNEGRLVRINTATGKTDAYLVDPATGPHWAELRDISTSISREKRAD